MEKIEDKELERIYGGEAISGPIISAITSIIKIIKEAGYDLGSGIRRLAEDNVCPLK